MGRAHIPSTSSTLLRALCAKDASAWHTFVDRYQSLLEHWCQCWGLQDADVDEVTGRVLHQLYEHLDHYRRERGLFRSWLKAVVHNAVLDHAHELRPPGAQGTGGQAVEEQLLAIAVKGDLDSVFEDLGARLEQDLEQAQAAVRERVLPTTWDAFRLTVLEDRPAQRVAAELGISVAHVYVYKHALRRLLRQELERVQAQDRDGENDCS